MEKKKKIDDLKSIKIENEWLTNAIAFLSFHMCASSSDNTIDVRTLI